MATVHLRVSGRVQGVGFRWFVGTAARQLGLTGWVQNMADGTVEIAASGPSDRLEELRRRVHTGPPAAKVTSVSDLEAIAGELDNPFSMRR
ncbi:MAG: acylphosphatase [Gemmatimonadaceae bacterium]